jgi:hypothetical protein
MSLAKRQRDRALALSLQQLLRRGTPPDRGEVTEAFVAELPEILGEPFFELREQVRRGKFRVDWQNAMFRQAAIDLGLLFEQNVEVVETLLGHLAMAEVTGRRTGLEIRALQSLLEDQLLTSQRGTNFFFTMFDDFVDFAKIDQVQSDVAIDLENDLITLAPESSTKRLSMAHLINQVAAPLTLVEPREGVARLVPGTKFGHAFEDLLTAWQHQILIEQQAPIEVAVTIPVVPPGQPSEEITKIQLHSLSPTPYTVFPLWAKDGVAFSRFQGISEPIRVEGDVAVIEFPPTEVTAVQLRLRKTAPDGEEETTLISQTDGRTQIRARRFYALFAFRQISFWKMGYRRHGTLISTVLTPPNTPTPNISKVSLDAVEDVPQGTRITYAVAPSSAPTSFVPITPLGRQDSEAPKIVDFGKTQQSIRDENPITINTGNPPTSLGAIRGTEFFALRSVPNANIFRSAQLWRGKNAWHCEREIKSTIRSVRNLFLDFSRSDVQRLYVFEEAERIGVHPSNDGTTEISIETRFPVLLESDEFQAKQDVLLPTDVSRPNYSIRGLIRRPVTGSVSSTQATGALTITAAAQTASQDANAQQTSPTAGRSGAVVKIAAFTSATLVPALLGTSGVLPDLVGIPFRLSYVTGGLTIAGVFTTLSAQIEADGTLTLRLDDPTELIRSASGTLAALSAAWEVLAINMTRAIREVSGNLIKLDRGQKLGVEDMIEVTYRRSLLPTEVPVTASLVVKSTTDESQVFVAGTDYTLDLGSRTLSRIPTGKIGISGDQSAQAVRVDFDFEEQLLGLVLYRTFLFNPEPTPKLTLIKITVDREHGEEVLLEAAGGILDLHDRDELPPLPSGWHQLVVRSNPVRQADGAVNKSSAIYQAINLKEKRSVADPGRFLFPASSHPDATGETTDKFTNYFTRQTFALVPLHQTTFRQLSTAVLKTDRTVFAIKPAAEAPATSSDAVVVNFDPRVSMDRLYFPPDLTGSGIPLDREDFEFSYAFTPAGVTSLTGLILRATLDRDPDVEGSVTPILRRYTLRISY